MRKETYAKQQEEYWLEMKSAVPVSKAASDLLHCH